MSKKILDACCGGRMFWFNKNNPDAIFTDIRYDTYTMKDNGKIRQLEVKPDVVADFRDLPFEENSFYLVVFDPPHLKSLGNNSWMAKKYGKLTADWRDDIREGFKECFRVLKPNGTLIFKWNEYDIPLKEVLNLAPQEPLFGHPSGKLQKTHWVCFMKQELNKTEEKLKPTNG